MLRWRVAVRVAMAGMFAGCQDMSVIERDEAAGFNGGFEVERNGLPVNWHVHAPPLKDGTVEVGLDTSDPPEGEKSLRLVVHEVGDAKGWRAPGFFQVTDAREGEHLHLRFWLENPDAKVRLFYRSERPKASPPGVEVIIEPGPAWREFEYEYTVPADHDNLRFEIGVLEPGTVRVDDVRIEAGGDE